MDILALIDDEPEGISFIQKDARLAGAHVCLCVGVLCVAMLNGRAVFVPTCVARRAKWVGVNDRETSRHDRRYMAGSGMPSVGVASSDQKARLFEGPCSTTFLDCSPLVWGGRSWGNLHLIVRYARNSFGVQQVFV